MLRVVASACATMFEKNKNGFIDLAPKAEEERNKRNRDQYDGTNVQFSDSDSDSDGFVTQETEENKRPRLSFEDTADPDSSFVTQYHIHKSSSGGENTAVQRAYADSSNSLDNDSFRYNAAEMNTPAQQQSDQSPHLLSGSSSDNKNQFGDDSVVDSQKIPLYSDRKGKTDYEDDFPASQTHLGYVDPITHQTRGPDLVERWQMERVFEQPLY